jgi:hypothetical protein
MQDRLYLPYQETAAKCIEYPLIQALSHAAINPDIRELPSIRALQDSSVGELFFR